MKVHRFESKHESRKKWFRKTTWKRNIRRVKTYAQARTETEKKTQVQAARFSLLTKSGWEAYQIREQMITIIMTIKNFRKSAELVVRKQISFKSTIQEKNITFLFLVYTKTINWLMYSNKTKDKTYFILCICIKKQFEWPGSNSEDNIFV